MSFVVRQATVDDVDTLTDMRMAFIDEVKHGEYEIPPEELKGRVRTSIQSMIPTGDLAAWFAEVAGEQVGMTMVAFHRRPPSNANVTGVEAYLMSVYTVPVWRGRGVATALLNATLSFIRNSEARRVVLTATETGRSVYQRLGFVSNADVMTLKL